MNYKELWGLILYGWVGTISAFFAAYDTGWRRWFWGGVVILWFGNTYLQLKTEGPTGSEIKEFGGGECV